MHIKNYWWASIQLNAVDKVLYKARYNILLHSVIIHPYDMSIIIYILALLLRHFIYEISSVHSCNTMLQVASGRTFGAEICDSRPERLTQDTHIWCSKLLIAQLLNWYQCGCVVCTLYTAWWQSRSM